jgi:hypothetical protein
MSDSKECFFISPIGDEGSDVRERSNNLMKYIIEEAVSDYGYSVVRADQMDEPGSITSQVIQKTVDSELVVADLTDHNPNVFYELAVRHATGKPYIQLIESTDSIPFDISDFRTIQYGLDVREADQAREEIRAQLESLENGDPEFDNPISKSAEMQSLRESTDPSDQNLAEILQIITNLDRKVNRIENNMETSTSTLADFAPSEPPFEVELNDRTVVIDDQPVLRSAIADIASRADVSPQELESKLKAQGAKITSASPD